MFKNLKNYLLTNHPLIWNTRFVTAGAVALIINIIFILIGYSAYSGVQELHNYRIYNDEESFILPSVLVSVLFFIVWLFFYTKNNAFKNYYPLKKGYLVKEFLLITIIIALNCSYIFSYRFGYASHAEQSVRQIQLVPFINRANQAMMFLPMQESDYEIGNSCDSIIQYYSRQDNSSSYGSDNNYDYAEIATEVEAAAYAVDGRISDAEQKYKDSIWEVFVTHFKDSIRNADNLHDKDRIWIDYDKFYPRPVVNYDVESPEPENYNYETETAAPIKERQKKYSYYFYCHQQFSLDNSGENEINSLTTQLDSNKSISKKGIALIKDKNEKAIAGLINNFKADMVTAKVLYEFNTEKYVKRALNDSIWKGNGYKMLISIYDNYDYRDSENGDNAAQNNGIAISDMNNFIDNTTKLQYSFSKQVGDAESVLVLIFVALSLAFSIFLFRLNGIKEFLLSIVAGGVLSLAIGLFMYLSRMNGTTESLTTFGTIGLALTLLGIFAVKNKFVKSKAAICLNIGAFSLGLLWIVLFGSLYEMLEPTTVFYNYGNLKDAFSIEKYSPFHNWLRTEYITILWIYVVIILLTIFLYLIPLSKRLRANPEE